MNSVIEYAYRVGDTVKCVDGIERVIAELSSRSGVAVYIFKGDDVIWLYESEIAERTPATPISRYRPSPVASATLDLAAQYASGLDLGTREMLDRVVAADMRMQSIRFTGEELSEWITEAIAGRVANLEA